MHLSAAILREWPWGTHKHLHNAIYKINTVSLFTQKQDFLTEPQTFRPGGKEVCSAQSKKYIVSKNLY